MADRALLADVMVASGSLTPEQKDKALKASQEAQCSFEEAVIKLGFASEGAVTTALSKQLGLPLASRENKILIPEKSQGLEKLVPENFARDHLAVPLFLEDGTLGIAMSDPTNVMLQDNIRVLTSKTIHPFVAAKTQILKAIDELYDGSGEGGLVGRTLEEGKKIGGAVAEESDSADVRVDLDKAISGSKDAQIISLINAVLKQAVAERASDIHLESFDNRASLRFRIDGILYEKSSPPKAMFSSLVSRIKILSKLDIAERRLPQDGTFSIKLQNRNIDLRVSICPTVYGEKVVMRILDKRAVNLDVEKIGFEPKQKADFLDAAHQPHGLIFLTGPTGSGKTTTLYSVLNTIKTPELNFMTIEDPVEIKLDGLNQVQVRSDIGLTFAAALRSFLRQDPDVILVGEVRDQETAQTCLRAALTGHLVLSTLHTNDAMSTVVRLIDLGIEPFLLSGSLLLAAAQRLVRILCPHCKTPYKPDPSQLASGIKEAMLPQAQIPNLANLVFYKPRGCDKCSQTGYMGRRAIYEIYRIIPEMREIIYKYGGDLARLREVAVKNEMWDLRASGWRKVLAGLTTTDEVLSVTMKE